MTLGYVIVWHPISQITGAH